MDEINDIIEWLQRQIKPELVGDQEAVVMREKAERVKDENERLWEAQAKVAALLNKPYGGAIWHLERGGYKRCGHADSALRLLYEVRAALEVSDARG